MNDTTMITYNLNNYTFSRDLKRYAKKLGQDSAPVWTIGYCTLEFVGQDTKHFSHEAKTLDASKPVETIKIHDAVNMVGKFHIQTTSERQQCNEATKDDWLSPVAIAATEEEIEALVIADLKENQQANNSINYKMAKTRLKLAANQPEIDSLTVKAITLHSGQVRAETLQDERIERLKESAKITKHQAQILTNAVNDDMLIFRDGGWHTRFAKFYVPPTKLELDELVDMDLLVFMDVENDAEQAKLVTPSMQRKLNQNNAKVPVGYVPTLKGSTLVRDCYL